MGYANCCRLCLQSLITKECSEDYFKIDAMVSDDFPSTLQQLIAECFQITFTDHESINKVCWSCYNDVQMVDAIRRRFLATDDLVKCYYAELNRDETLEIQDIKDLHPAKSENEEVSLTEEQIKLEDVSMAEEEYVDEEVHIALEQVEDEVDEEYLLKDAYKELGFTLKQALECVKNVDKTAKPKRKKKKSYRPRPKTAKKYTCFICKTDHEARQDFDKHLVTHVGNIPRVCHSCDAPVTTVRGFNAHLRQVHFRKANFPCNVCDDVLSSNFKLQAHIKRIHEGIVEEAPKPQHICSYCGKSFSRGSMLKVHENIHTRAVLFRCSYCTKFVGTSRNALNRHERIHTAEKAYKCDECDAAFTQSNALRTHKDCIHSTERPFKCTLCDASYGHKYSFLAHLQCHEKHPNPADVKIRKKRNSRKRKPAVPAITNAAAVEIATVSGDS